MTSLVLIRLQHKISIKTLIEQELNKNTHSDNAEVANDGQPDVEKIHGFEQIKETTVAWR